MVDDGEVKKHHLNVSKTTLTGTHSECFGNFALGILNSPIKGALGNLFFQSLVILATQNSKYKPVLCCLLIQKCKYMALKEHYVTLL